MVSQLANTQPQSIRSLEFINAQRRAEIHLGGASVEVVIEDVPMIAIEMDQGHPAYAIHVWGSPGIPESTIGHSPHYFKIGDSTEKAIETCKRYVGLLEKLVREFAEALPGN